VDATTQTHVSGQIRFGRNSIIGTNKRSGMIGTMELSANAISASSHAPKGLCENRSARSLQMAWRLPELNISTFVTSPGQHYRLVRKPLPEMIPGVVLAGPPTDAVADPGRVMVVPLIAMPLGAAELADECGLVIRTVDVAAPAPVSDLAPSAAVAP